MISKSKTYFLLLLLLLLELLQIRSAVVVVVEGYSSSKLKYNFYSETCEDAEKIVFQVVSESFHTNPKLAPGIIRMHFHDCFVNGCDASVLLNGPNSELVALPNLSIKGIEVIEQAKANVESACPGVVTCADIIALAARDSTFLLGGKYYEIKTDGKSPGVVDLPVPSSTISEAMNLFTNVGLSKHDLTVLLGSHTVGVSQCQFFSTRLYNFSGTGKPDPSMDAGYRAALERQCPEGGDGTVEQELDRHSVFNFDSSYYQNVLRSQGLLQVDQELAYDSRTKGLVEEFAHSFPSFAQAFSESMIRMSEIHVKGPSHGEVRKVCSYANY